MSQYPHQQGFKIVQIDYSDIGDTPKQSMQGKE